MIDKTKSLHKSGGLSKAGKKGKLAILIGGLLAVILGLANSFLTSYYEIVMSVLMIAGILIGLLNLSKSDSSKFLLPMLALVLTAYIGDSTFSIFGSLFMIGRIFSDILNSLLITFVPAAIIIAFKSVLNIASS